MKLLFVVVAAALLVSLAGWRPSFAGEEIPHSPRAEGERHAVVVELFTSEGCSSCPPADRLLMQLEAEQPVPGAEIIALGWHVDYWDRLGWRDAFSSDQFTARQYDYAEVFGTNGVYTPQMVIDGTTEFLGSDAAQARRSITRAAQVPKASVDLSLIPDAGERKLKLGVRITGPDAAQATGKADVLLAITENGLASNVERGENAGHHLVHRAVVRQLTLLGNMDLRPPSEFTAKTAVSWKANWKRENLRAVVFVQDQSSRKILGAAALPLSNR